MIAANPDSTSGELFAIYKGNYPNTIRSRNEIAKRVSDLLDAGIISSSGKRKCDFTGSNAQTWKRAEYIVPHVQFSNDEAEDRIEAPAEVHAWDEDMSEEKDCDCGCCSTSREETARKVAEAAGERCMAIDPEDEAFLRTFRSTLAELKSNPLFKSLAPAKMRADAEKLEKALRYF